MGLQFILIYEDHGYTQASSTSGLRRPLQGSHGKVSDYTSTLLASALTYYLICMLTLFKHYVMSGDAIMFNARAKQFA